MRRQALLVIGMLLMPLLAGPLCALPASCPMAGAEEPPCHGSAPEPVEPCCCEMGSAPPALPRDEAAIHPEPAALRLPALPLRLEAPASAARSASARPALAGRCLDRLALLSVLVL